MKIPRCLLVFVTLMICLGSLSFGQFGRRRDSGRERGACFFRDADFRGDFFCVKAGESLREVPPGFNDEISSIRITGGASVVVFKDHNFEGRRLEFNRDVRDLSRIRDGNDMISSIRVR